MEAARDALLAAHAASGLSAVCCPRDVQPLLRAAEGLLRAAVAAISTTTSSTPSPSTMAPPAPAAPAKRRRRRPRSKAKVDLGKPAVEEVQPQSAEAPGDLALADSVLEEQESHTDDPRWMAIDCVGEHPPVALAVDVRASAAADVREMGDPGHEASRRDGEGLATCGKASGASAGAAARPTPEELDKCLAELDQGNNMVGPGAVAAVSGDEQLIERTKELKRLKSYLSGAVGQEREHFPR